MSVVTYDPLFDRKVVDGAAALLAQRGIGRDRNDFNLQHQRACEEARLVLLTAMRIDADVRAGAASSPRMT